MQITFFENYFKGFRKVLDYSLIESHPQKEVILKRLEIIEFFKEYGGEATAKAYKVKKSSVYLWIQKLRKSGGNLVALFDSITKFTKGVKRYVISAIDEKTRFGFQYFFNYPRHPKSNAIVERFNRTTQEQHINLHLDEMTDIETFNKGLTDYLLWYNTEKPHKSLNKLTPLDFLINSTFPHTKNSNMFRYSTST